MYRALALSEEMRQHFRAAWLIMAGVPFAAWLIMSFPPALPLSLFNILIPVGAYLSNISHSRPILSTIPVSILPKWAVIPINSVSTPRFSRKTGRKT